MYWEYLDPKIQIHYFFIAFLLALLIVVIGRRKQKIAAKAALILYMFLVFASTVLSRKPLPRSIAMIAPGWSIIRVIQTGELSIKAEIILNLLMMLPIGVLLPIAFRRIDGWDVLLTALCFSAIIEFSQLFFRLGWFEIDDMIYNTLGAVVGWLPVHFCRILSDHVRLRFK